MSQSGPNHPAPEGSSVGGGMMLLVIPASAFGLGVWQVFRWRWKLGLIEDMERRTQSVIEAFPEDVSKLDEMEFTQVKLRGKFDYTNEVLVGPRSLLKDGPKVPKNGVIDSVKRESGYHIVTPFEVAGRNFRILVNRGWIPTPNTSSEYRVTKGGEEVEIIAVVRKNEQRPTFVNERTGRKDLFGYRNVPQMARMLNTSEILLDLNTITDHDVSSAYPIPGQTRVTLRNDHVNYFLTWFSLAGITGYMWHRLFVRKLPLR